MAAKIFRINYKSDFTATLESDAGWMTPFCIKFWTGSPQQAYFVGWDGTTYNHCSFDPSEPKHLVVQFDDHHLPIGELKFQVAYHFTVDDFPNDTEDEVINQAGVTTEIDGEEYKVMLDFTGETAPEIQFSLPAYANEAQRIANEQQRIANEQQRILQEQQRIEQEGARVVEFGQIQDQAAADHRQAVSDHGIAVDDHTRANSDHGIAVDDHTQAGNDHTRAESDHGIAVDDHTQAGNDHTRAESDHGIAVDDHTQAGNDHTRANSDHGIAVDDHTQAGNDHTRAGEDHTRAENDHTRAESDHDAVEVFVESLGAFDLSQHNAVGGVLAKYATLQDALTALNALPASYKYGGMSFKYVDSSDNKYVQYRLMSDSFNTTPDNWQGVDAEIVAGSRNLVESGGVIEKYGNVVKQTEQAVAGSSYNNYFHIYAKSGNVIYIKATGTSGIIGGDALSVYIGAIGGTSLGNVIVNGVVTRIVASEDIDTIDVARHLSGVSGSGSITVEVTVESDIISRVTEIANSQNDYCICSTVADNSVKSVSVPYYTFKNGGFLKIKFEHSTTSDNCTLNINGLGAKALYYEGIRAGILNTWMDNEVVEVYYDSANEIFYASKFDTEANLIKANIGYYICDTVAASGNKVINDKRFNKLFVGGSFKVKFTNGINTSATINLSINGSSSMQAPLYYKGAPASTSNVWADGEVVEVYYDGEKFNAEPYHVIVPTIEPEFHTVSNTVASVTDSTYSNVININIKKGNLIKINANVADMLESGSNIGVGIKTNTEFYAFIYRDQDGLFFIAPYDITSMTLYLASTYVKQSNDITFTITDYGKSASNAVEYADIIGENSINPSTLGDGNISLFIGSKIKRGEPFAIRIEDKDGTIGNRAASLRYQSSGSQALSTIETIPQKSELSEIHTLGEDITYLNVGVTKGTGTAPFGSGTFKVTVYKFAVDNVIIPFIKNNPADKKVAVNITNPYWSKCYQFTSPQSIYNTLEPSVKGIFVKFDNITIYDGRYRIIKQWSDVLSDIGKTGTVADDRTENVLLLNNGGAYNWALAFDLITNKFVIKEDTTALPTARYIYLAYSKEGNGCGEICYQYDSIKVANTRTLIKDVNQSYITRLRTKQMELLQAKDFFCFGFCTDVHFGMLNTGVFYPNVTNTIMNDTDNYIGLDAIINGGDDILNGTMVKQHGLDALKKEFESIDLSKFIPCVGNHDHNGVGDTMASVQKREWVITDKELETLYFRKCSNTYRPDGKLYYYRDFDEKKVRIIVLNTQDVPIEFNNNDELVYDPNIIFGIGQEQFNFIINALDISGKSDANDWKIMFVMHVPPYSASEGFVSNSELINRSIFRGILNAFVTKGTYSGSYIDSEYSGIFSVNVSVDYQTNPKPGKMIGVFCGHTHKDQYVDTDGFNCIGTQSSYPTDDLGKGGSPYMPVHTYDEFAIDVVILDDMQEKIVIKRLGHIPENQESGDREYSYDVN